MFVTIDNTTQHVPDISGEALVASGTGRKATAMEAADCVIRYVVNGDWRMNEANEEFKGNYGNDK